VECLEFACNFISSILSTSYLVLEFRNHYVKPKRRNKK
jgi:hypothetical protein